MLQGVGRLFDVLSRLRLLVGQQVTDLHDLLLQLGTLEDTQRTRVQGYRDVGLELCTSDTYPSGFKMNNDSTIYSQRLYLVSRELVLELLHLGLCVVDDALCRVHRLHAVLSEES